MFEQHDNRDGADRQLPTHDAFDYYSTRQSKLISERDLRSGREA
jgi:hypothetical protein